MKRAFISVCRGRKKMDAYEGAEKFLREVVGT
jgi:hypothetical protein